MYIYIYMHRVGVNPICIGNLSVLTQMHSATQAVSNAIGSNCINIYIERERERQRERERERERER